MQEVSGGDSLIRMVNKLLVCSKKLSHWNKSNKWVMQHNIGELACFGEMGGSLDWDRRRRVEKELEDLVRCDEIFWRRHSRASWMRDGDHITKFFHANAFSRRTHNKISGSLDVKSNWKEGDTDMADIIGGYFSNIFSSSCLFDYFLPKILGGGGDDVTKLCLECFNDGRSVDMINLTLVCLIPKVKKVERVTTLRPISLCIVLYKCTSKALANRLQKLLDKVISESQCAFIPGRLITDKAMVGFECKHYFRQKVNSKKGFMVLKLDMAKAYDRGRVVLFERYDAQYGLLKWLHFKNNGVCVYGSIRPSKGLRQRDPLSPYLFFICAEGFSSLVSKSERVGDLSGFRCSCSSPKIKHRFYANDSLMFTRANYEECLNIRRLLEVYLSASGQLINFNKSVVCFGRQVSLVVKKDLADVLGMKVVESHETYLGLPHQTSKCKRAMFDNIKQQV
ncbi:hypothetical protein Ddye_010913 [Dipteronia dyeriana]|uniref:Reverse transcriptase domain-containing protein n=1 Tax=Dipteronia dyeriana TaxID=168575 RepID=A0AAD9XES7_9ROSI|nr:hypothetical protein Ddye_010913 [Dipteronia dyeriana]